MGEEFEISAVTNDIFTREDAEFLQKAAVLSEGRVVGVETGGCPHTAVRDDISMNLEAVEAFEKEMPQLDLIFIESGGDNLAASFSPELVDASIYVIDVAGGDKVPRKGGPGVTRSELLIINKIDLAPLVGADEGRRPLRHGPRRHRTARRRPDPFHLRNGWRGNGRGYGLGARRRNRATLDPGNFYRKTRPSRA